MDVILTPSAQDTSVAVNESVTQESSKGQNAQRQMDGEALDGGFAEFERALDKGRQREGIAAKQRGAYKDARNPHS